ncbi:uncharacterized protein LOC111259561 [Varroa jacobsoni]|uniref:uncharacterized protein LOC111259561 n=1 Tax=Varroa jacobsoni TaxID=62625 RepID=UPI000BF7FA19|nr:uncharacterized protein LOC111259561 [Varroa jacobsoni]XP_022687423.1 uncharacterized protein LOC111259561 [Varroa jacobsoni]XP_022687424.1 uncharacterized protein LOC111259561 [Varroa jacobsoni]XP_022687425.1 uncharacterized protein LOC111259561 [Varroa jacobsoni]XP_022687426.1 uncharacterized protein LOC111259561 [Varroa jacobsoni]
MTSSADSEQGKRTVEVKSKGFLTKNLAFFRMMLALTSMLVSAALGGILVWHPLSDKFLDDFRTKWKTIFWFYSAASLAVLITSFCLEILRKRSRVTCGIIIADLLMVILSVYIAHVASADSGMLRGDTNDNEERPKVFLIAISCLFSGLFVLELVLLLLMFFYHRAMFSKSRSDVVASAGRDQNARKHLQDEIQKFISKSNEQNSDQVLQHKDFTRDKVAPGIAHEECLAKDTCEDEMNCSARPLLPPNNLVVNQIYETSNPPKSLHKLKEVPPPSRPVTTEAGETILPNQKKKNFSSKDFIGAGERIPPSPLPLAMLPTPSLVDDSSARDQVVTGSERPLRHFQPANDRNTDVLSTNSEAPLGSESAGVSKERTTPKLQRQPSFKRFELKPSLWRRSSTASTNPHFPPYEGTRFEYYNPDQGTFALPIAQFDDVF